MKTVNFINILALKLFVLFGIAGLNNSLIYSQEILEDAIVTVSFSDKNDSKTIIATAMNQSGLPIEDLELYFFIQRTFSLLPIGDGFNATDEEGKLEVEFPNDLPGDIEGNLIIVTKIIESDFYNDLTLETTKNWGIPVKLSDPTIEKRSLWADAANAPMSLIISVSLMIFSVWYIICYILYKLYKISKIKPINN